MQYLWLLTIAFFCQQDVPYKPGDQFELNLDYKFRQRPPSDNGGNLLAVNEGAGGLLPFVAIKLKVLKLEPDEVRYRVTNNKGEQVLGKKITAPSEIEFEMGFTADLKDRVKPYEYTVSFLSQERDAKSRIVIYVDQDGSFFVNGTKRGKL